MRTTQAVRLLCGVGLALAAGCASTGDLEKVLREGGFSGALEGNTKIKKVGAVKSGETVVTFFYYQREFGSRRLTQRLIAVENGKYVGMYPINDPPVMVKGDEVCFPYEPDGGDCIALVHGRLPGKAYLDGEWVELFK